MRKVIFAINLTINGSANHTSGIVDDELHDFYADWFDNVDVILFGRKTYQLMESFWPIAHKDSRSTKSILRFADKINSVSKIVVSKTLTEVDWNNSQIFKGNIKDEISRLKKEKGKSISIGGLSLASYLTSQGLIDEYWFLVHPIFSDNIKNLFQNLIKPVQLKLIDIQKLKSGVVVSHYHKL